MSTQEGDGKSPVRLSIAPNPSHLEFIGPVVLGMVRAEQTRLQDTAREKVMGLLIHGDAAFAGLGVVAECLQLADTPGVPLALPPFAFACDLLLTSQAVWQDHCSMPFRQVMHAFVVLGSR